MQLEKIRSRGFYGRFNLGIVGIGHQRHKAAAAAQARCEGYGLLPLQTPRALRKKHEAGKIGPGARGGVHGVRTRDPADFYLDTHGN